MGYNWTYLLFGLLLLCNLIEECGWCSADVMPSDFYTYHFSGTNRNNIIDTTNMDGSFDFSSVVPSSKYWEPLTDNWKDDEHHSGKQDPSPNEPTDNTEMPTDNWELPSDDYEAKLKKLCDKNFGRERVTYHSEEYPTVDLELSTVDLAALADDFQRNLRNYKKWKLQKHKRLRDMKQIFGLGLKKGRTEVAQPLSKITAPPFSENSFNTGAAISGLYIVGTFLVSINCFVLLTMIDFMRRRRKSKCVCCNVFVKTRNYQKRNMRHGRAKLVALEENSETDSESEPEVIYGRAGRGLREKMAEGIQRFGKLGENRKPGGTVQVTEYEEMAPQYLYTSVSQDGVSIITRGEIKEIKENVHEEIPAGGWNLEDAADDTSEYPQAGVVPMKEYEEVSVTYHRAAYDEDTK